MKDNKFTIRIDSILGGHSPTTHFARPDQFRASLGIDPAQPQDDSTTSPYSQVASGLLRPTPSQKKSGSTLKNAPLWIIDQPKGQLVYVYDSGGSTYTTTGTTAFFSELSDGGSMSNASGNGCEYYDNYIYFSKNTTVARYGPLDGSAGFDGDYWVTTLSKTALSNTTYPTDPFLGINYPNHVLHRHSDGKLYIADVVDNKGTIHYIATTKTTAEGDTNDGSTYNKVQVGYGLWPTAIESYGSDLVIAFIENSGSFNTRQSRAKIAFWDTTSTSVNKIVWVEFPDPIITALKNVNGVLYVFSGNLSNASNLGTGFRVSRFVGGYTFEEVFYHESGIPPFAGAIDGTADRLLIGSATVIPEANGCVWSLGLQKRGLSQGVFNVMAATGGDSSTLVTSLKLAPPNTLNFSTPLIGWSNGASSTYNGIDSQGTYGNVPSVWWSQTFRIGQPFKITKIRIPLAQAVAANMIVTPKIYTDDGVGTYTLTEINNTNDSGKKNIIRRSGSAGEVITGDHNFWIELRWTGSALCTVGLPITIEGEYIDD